MTSKRLTDEILDRAGKRPKWRTGQSAMQHHRWVPSMANPHDRLLGELAKQKGSRCCHCSSSRCLQMYCECFARGELCKGCDCKNCLNYIRTEGEQEDGKQSERTKAIYRVLHRNSRAFMIRRKGSARKRAAMQQESRVTDRVLQNASIVPNEEGLPVPLASHEVPDDTLMNKSLPSMLDPKGCRCKKNHCLKGYCECFQVGVHCTDACECTDCKNHPESTKVLHDLRQNDHPAIHGNPALLSHGRRDQSVLSDPCAPYNYVKSPLHHQQTRKHPMIRHQSYASVLHDDMINRVYETLQAAALGGHEMDGLPSNDGLITSRATRNHDYASPATSPATPMRSFGDPIMAKLYCHEDPDEALPPSPLTCAQARQKHVAILRAFLDCLNEIQSASETAGCATSTSARAPCLNHPLQK